MEVRCDKCQARYRVADEKIGPQGLTMKCGKCGNQFRVSREAAPGATVANQPPVPSRPPATPAPTKPAPAPAPKRPQPESGATIMFGQSPVTPARPAATKPPTAARPPAAASAPSASAPPAKPLAGAAAKAPVARPATPAAASPADEGAGRTMMFQTGNIKAPPPAAKAAPKAPAAEARPAAPETGSTMVFGQSPLAKPATPMPKAVPGKPPVARPAAEEGAATMVFGQSPVAPARTAAPVAKAPPAQAEPDSGAEAESEAPTEIGSSVNPDHAGPDESAAPPAEGDAGADESRGVGSTPLFDEGGMQVDGMKAAEEPAAEESAEGTFDKAPPRGLLISIAAGVAALVLILIALAAWKKLGHHALPPAALEALAAAQAAADKDSLPSLADAEAKAKDAIEQAGARTPFPQGAAQLAQIDVQWADALTDQATLLTAKGQGETDEAKKVAADQKIADLQTQAKGKLKAAFDTLSAAIKADSRSPDLELALAEYYRAQRSGSNMNKELKKAQALKAGDARVALVQGEALAQEEDGGEKALPKLKAALAGAPQSARIHFRLAMTGLAMKNNDEALKELKETLRLSPQHERAKMAMEQLATTPAQ